MLAFAVLAYLLFLASFLYLLAFLANLPVPRTVDRGPATAPLTALLVDLALLVQFTVPHSIMARPGFKRWWTRYVPEPAERSVYVLVASLSLGLLMAAWRPLPGDVWVVRAPAGVALVTGLFAFGLLLVVWATFMIDHFDLFGVRQAYLLLARREYTPVPFQVGAAYRYLRHPMMLGFLIALWAATRMTWGHLLLSFVLSLYILIGIELEQRTLARELGEPYRRYLRLVPAFLPRPWGRRRRRRRR